MTPTSVVNLHVAEHEKLHVDAGAIWSRVSSPELGIAPPLTGLAKRAVAEFNECVARELAEYESLLDLQPIVQALTHWWSSFHKSTRDAWDNRRWLTEEFISEWETSRGRLLARNPLSASQQRVLAARVTGVESEALNATGAIGASGHTRLIRTRLS